MGDASGRGVLGAWEDVVTRGRQRATSRLPSVSRRASSRPVTPRSCPETGGLRAGLTREHVRLRVPSSALHCSGIVPVLFRYCSGIVPILFRYCSGSVRYINVQEAVVHGCRSRSCSSSPLRNCRTDSPLFLD